MIQVACTEEICLREPMIKSILQSNKTLCQNPDVCCSVCANSDVLVVFPVPCPTIAGSNRWEESCHPVRKTTQALKAQLMKELITWRTSIAKD